MRKIVRRPLRPGAMAPDLPAPVQEAEDVSGNDTAWTDADLILPRPKRLVSLRIDADVLEYFQAGGKGYQTRMNAVLRAYMAAHKR